MRIDLPAPLLVPTSPPLPSPPPSPFSLSSHKTPPPRTRILLRKLPPEKLPFSFCPIFTYSHTAPRFYFLRWNNHKQDQIQFPDGGGRKQERPNRFSSVSKKEQTKMSRVSRKDPTNLSESNNDQLQLKRPNRKKQRPIHKKKLVHKDELLVESSSHARDSTLFNIGPLGWPDVINVRPVAHLEM